MSPKRCSVNLTRCCSPRLAPSMSRPGSSTTYSGCITAGPAAGNTQKTATGNPGSRPRRGLCTTTPKPAARCSEPSRYCDGCVTACINEALDLMRDDRGYAVTLPADTQRHLRAFLDEGYPAGQRTLWASGLSRGGTARWLNGFPE